MRKLFRTDWLPLLLSLVFFLVCVGLFRAQTAPGGAVRVTVTGGNLPAAAESAPGAPGMLEGERLDLNAASPGDLTRLPGIGEQRAAEIVAYREEHGGFSDVEELLQVPGIGPGILEGLRDYVTVGEGQD